MTIVVEALNLGGQGLTVMVKDTLDVAGVPTKASSAALASAPAAPAHAQVVQRLLDAGCRLTGKTSLHELAFGTTGINLHTGTPPNPKYPGRIPGGSSSGSAAAVAAGLVDFSLGTDTGGSVRIPACCCGIFGFKPTFGRVSREGVMPAYSTLDCVGPFAATLPTLTLAMRAIDPTFGVVAAPQNIRVGVVEVQASEAVLTVMGQVIKALGLPQARVQLNMMDAAYTAAMAIINRETYDACQPLLASGLIGADVAGRLQAAGTVTEDALADAERVRTRFTDEVDAALAEHDVLLLPTMPDYPLKLEDARDTRAVLGMTSLVRPFNLSGHPALTIPLVSQDGLPVGLQLVAAKGADEVLLAMAEQLLSRIYGV